jgi:hypothetical protein
MAANDNLQVILSGTQLNAEVAGLLHELTLATPHETEGSPLVWLVPEALTRRLADVLEHYMFPSRPLADSIIRIDPKRLAAEIRALAPESEDGEVVGYLFNHNLVTRIHYLAKATSRPNVTFVDEPVVTGDDLFEAIRKATLKLPG